MSTFNKFWVQFMMVGIMLVGIVSVACTSSSAGSEPAMEEMAHDEEMTHDEGMAHDEAMAHEDDHSQRIPNPHGAAVSITAPADGTTFAAADEVLVEVNVENFDLAQDGNHWHVYVDGSSWGMVTGGNTDQPLRGLEPGMHEISVFIAGGDHIEFEDGDSIMITITES